MSGSIDMTVIMESLYVVGILLCAAGGLYAAYWSFAIRRMMMVRSYRNQALTVGMVSLYGVILISVFYVVWLFAPSLTKSAWGSVDGILYGILPPVMLAWVDSSIRVGRRLDPLLRDSFRWSTARWILWSAMAICIITFLVSGGISSTYGVVTILGLASAFVLVGISGVAVFVTAKRAGDRNYRRSLEWFVGFIVFTLAMNAGFFPLTILVSDLFTYTPINLIWAIMANFVLIPMMWYCMYRCSRSLVPLNRISLIDKSQQAGESPLGALT
jgi:hypothetical protein